MSGSISKRLSNRYLRDIFEYFIKYVGSSALDSPAFMNLMPNIQMEFGLWYVSGRLYQLAQAFRRRLDECGVTLHLGHEVLQIDHAGGAVTGVIVRGSDGTSTTLQADFVVSNLEVIPAMREAAGCAAFRDEEAAPFPAVLLRNRPSSWTGSCLPAARAP